MCEDLSSGRWIIVSNLMSNGQGTRQCQGREELREGADISHSSNSDGKGGSGMT